MTDSKGRPDGAPAKTKRERNRGTSGPDLPGYWLALDDLEIHREELRQRGNELLEAHSTIEAIEDLLAEAPLGYMILDASGTIRECNPTAAKMMGVQRGTIVG